MLHTFVALVQDKPGVLTRAAAVCLTCTLAGCGGRLKIDVSKGQAVIHVETLGEYPTTIRSFQVAPANHPTAPLFSIQGLDNFQTWNFKLHSGLNQTSLMDTSHGRYKVIAPSEENEFRLSPQTNYIATACFEQRCSTGIFSLAE